MYFVSLESLNVLLMRIASQMGLFDRVRSLMLLANCLYEHLVFGDDGCKSLHLHVLAVCFFWRLLLDHPTALEEEKAAVYASVVPSLRQLALNDIHFILLVVCCERTWFVPVHDCRGD